MLGFVGGSPNRPGRGHCAEEWERFPLPAKFPPYSQSALPDQCNSLSSPPFEKRSKPVPAFAQHDETTILILPTVADQSSFILYFILNYYILYKLFYIKLEILLREFRFLVEK